jgi:hypothetical protein
LPLAPKFSELIPLSKIDMEDPDVEEISAEDNKQDMQEVKLMPNELEQVARNLQSK